MALLNSPTSGGTDTVDVDTDTNTTTTVPADSTTGLTSNTGSFSPTAGMDTGAPTVGITDGGDLSAPTGGTQNEVVTSDPSGIDTVTADNPSVNPSNGTDIPHTGPPVVGVTEGGDLSAPDPETGNVTTSDPSGIDTVTAENPETNSSSGGPDDPDPTVTTPTTGGSGGFLPEFGGLFAVLMAVVAALYVTLGGD